MSVKDGGAAFPHPLQGGRDCSQGMTLRDYFAAQALNGILSGRVKGEIQTQMRGKLAYEIADEMIEARGL